MEGTSYKITPINVGSGDSILVQVHGIHGDKHYLIDGGLKEYLSNIERCLRFYNLIKRDKMAGKRVLQCGVIVTHPDQDHVNGITELMKKYYITGDIIITEAFNKKFSSEHSQFLQEFYSQLTSSHCRAELPSSSERIICCQSPTETCLRYVPRSRTCDIDDIHVSESGSLHTTDKGSDRKQVWNKSSIITTVSKPHSTAYAAVLTGDSFGDITVGTLNLDRPDGKHTQIFQVPHHGSKKNIQVDKDGTLSRCTKLYSSFTADVYVISGSDKIHPHAEVLSGILKAVYQKWKAVYQKLKADQKEVSGKIVLTGTRGLNAEKIIKSTCMPTGRDYLKFLQRAMRIMHIDDIGIYCKQCEQTAASRPFITVIAGLEDCKVSHGILWTPETYYKERRKIVCPCRERNMDVFGWTTSLEHDIDSFYGMRLLKVPFHEEPWQDARDQQYVFIVIASLEFGNYRQVLYLKEIKSAHNKLYEMFAYQSDLCWTRKYVPRIFQLRESTIYHPDYYRNSQTLNAYIDQLYPTK